MQGKQAHVRIEFGSCDNPSDKCLGLEQVLRLPAFAVMTDVSNLVRDMARGLRIAFAANRNIGLQALRLLLEHGIEPVVLVLPKSKTLDPAVAEMQRTVPHVPVIHGKIFREPKGIEQLQALDLDYFFSVHFPYIIPQSVLDVPRIGGLNLHPAYLPFNRGWHTPSWAILEQTPYGATLHWVDEGTDTGDIALQRRVEVQPTDTADTLYARVLAAEIELLREAIPLLESRALPRIPQEGQGTAHVKSDLTRMRRIDLDQHMQARDLLRQIRALTTNRDDEAAYFEVDGERYLVQLSVRRDVSEQRPPLKIFRAA